MNFRAASVLFAFAFVTLPIEAQSPPTVQSLASDLAALTERVAKLEGQIVAADLVGTYALNGFQIELSGGAGRPAQVASYVFAGTVTLNAGRHRVFHRNAGERKHASLYHAGFGL